MKLLKKIYICKNYWILFIYPNWQIKQVVINSISKLIKNMTENKIKIENVEKIIDMVKWHIADYNLKKKKIYIYLSY
jgi:hypothetical protein